MYSYRQKEIRIKIHTLASVLVSLRKLSDGPSLDLTCPVPCIVEVHCKGVYFMLSLPGWRRTVLIVGVSVVVVDVLPRQDRGARWAAHGCCHKGIDEMSTSVFHDTSCFIHHLHRTWKRKKHFRIIFLFQSQELRCYIRDQKEAQVVTALLSLSEPKPRETTPPASVKFSHHSSKD